MNRAIYPHDAAFVLLQFSGLLLGLSLARSSLIF